MGPGYSNRSTPSFTAFPVSGDVRNHLISMPTQSTGPGDQMEARRAQASAVRRSPLLPSEAQVRRGDGVVHGDAELTEKLGCNTCARAAPDADFKPCCMESGRCDGVNRGYYFQGVTVRPRRAVGPEGRLPVVPQQRREIARRTKIGIGYLALALNTCLLDLQGCKGLERPWPGSMNS
jgi:hypothetical protein